MTTPMMQQYWDAKNQHPGMLLLFRMGDFYELFDQDAQTANRVLGITLTSRDKQMPMAGFPYHQLDNYLHKLIHAGFRVAVCDQVEDAAQAKGLVRREVTRVVTPGTVTEDDLLDPRSNNHLVALYDIRGDTIGFAWLDVSTGSFHAADIAKTRLVDELARLAPAECVCAEREKDLLAPLIGRLPSAPALTCRPDWTFDSRTASTALLQHFRVSTLNGFGFDDGMVCIQAAGALLAYAQEMLKTQLGHLRRLQP